jgi:hypothetical protein
MKYDDASWHYGGDFPKDLPDAAGATHTGMFVAWALLAGLAGKIHINDFPEFLEKLRSHTITPAGFFLEACDGKFTDEDLNDEGNAFTQVYFDLERSSYLADYNRTLAKGLPSLYHVRDTWDNFEKLRPILETRFKNWQKKKSSWFRRLTSRSS